MTGSLPTRKEAEQLHTLRVLREKRSRERCAVAKKELTEAEHAVRRRQQLIRDSKHAIDSLAQAVVTSLAPHLPRWNGVVSAGRARLHEQLEREEDAMIGEARRLKEAGEAVERARIDLSRAMARERVVRELADQVRTAQALAVEQRAEVETEDQGRGAPGNGRP